MNPLNPTYVSRSEFRKALNLKCHKELGIGMMDLPDIICIDDVWWENMTEKEAIVMIDSCIEDFKLECSPWCIHNECMKNEKWIIEIRDLKVRQPFAPKQKAFRNKKAYNRKAKFNLQYAWNY